MVSSVKHHAHFVVAVTSTKRVFYVFATSDKSLVELSCLHVEGKTDPRHLVTMVEVAPEDCSVLSHVSYINTNLSFDKDEYSLTRLQTFSHCKGAKASDMLMKRLTVGLLSSRATKPILRNLLLEGLPSPSAPSA